MDENTHAEPEKVVASPAHRLLESHVHMHYPDFMTGVADGFNLSPMTQFFSIAMGEAFGGDYQKGMAEMTYAALVTAFVK